MTSGPFGLPRPFTVASPAIKVVASRRARTFRGFDVADFESDLQDRIERSDIDNRVDVFLSEDQNTMFVSFPNQEMNPEIIEKVRQEVVKRGGRMSPKLSRPTLTVVAL